MPFTNRTSQTKVVPMMPEDTSSELAPPLAAFARPKPKQAWGMGETKQGLPVSANLARIDASGLGSRSSKEGSSAHQLAALIERYNGIVTSTEPGDDVTRLELLTEIITLATKKATSDHGLKGFLPTDHNNARSGVYGAIQRAANAQMPTALLQVAFNPGDSETIDSNQDRKEGWVQRVGNEAKRRAQQSLNQEDPIDVAVTGLVITDVVDAAVHGSGGMVGDRTATQVSGVWQSFQGIFENMQRSLENLVAALRGDPVEWASVHPGNAMAESEKFLDNPCLANSLPVVGDIVGLVMAFKNLGTHAGAWHASKQAASSGPLGGRKSAKVVPLGNLASIPNQGPLSRDSKEAKLGGKSTADYAYRKLTRKMAHLAYGVMKSIIKIGTFFAGAVGYPFAYTAGLVTDLMFLIKDTAKAAYKTVTGQRGVHREQAADNIIETYRQNPNDGYAKAMMEAYVPSEQIRALIQLDPDIQATLYDSAKENIRKLLATGLRSKA